MGDDTGLATAAVTVTYSAIQFQVGERPHWGTTHMDCGNSHQPYDQSPTLADRITTSRVDTDNTYLSGY
jgi:phage gpG-like protein